MYASSVVVESWIEEKTKLMMIIAKSKGS
jgi:hypothetical protein